MSQAIYDTAVTGGQLLFSDTTFSTEVLNAHILSSSTFDVLRSTFDVLRSTFYVRRSTFDVRNYVYLFATKASSHRYHGLSQRHANGK